MPALGLKTTTAAPAVISLCPQGRFHPAHAGFHHAKRVIHCLPLKAQPIPAYIPAVNQAARAGVIRHGQEILFNCQLSMVNRQLLAACLGVSTRRPTATSSQAHQSHPSSGLALLAFYAVTGQAQRLVSA